jgi:hypothetical protein
VKVQSQMEILKIGRLPMYALSRLPQFAQGAALVASTLACSLPLSAQWLDYPTPGIPRMKYGKPNLSASAPNDATGKPDRVAYD